LQPEQGEADFGLALAPRVRGTGSAIDEVIVRRAFAEHNLASVTVPLPTTCTRVSGVSPLAYAPEAEVEIAGESFVGYRRGASSPTGDPAGQLVSSTPGDRHGL